MGEDQTLLIHFEKRIKRNCRRREGMTSKEKLWLWCAAACELGRFSPNATPGRMLTGILIPQLRIMKGIYRPKTGRRNVQPTGVTPGLVQHALKSLPGETGTMIEICEKVE